MLKRLSWLLAAVFITLASGAAHAACDYTVPTSGPSTAAAFAVAINEELGCIQTAIAAAAVSDGDKGDISVSSGGAVYSVDNGAVAVIELSGLGAGVGTFLGTPSSANLAGALTDETGSGANVFAISPTLVTPAIGAATATTVNKVTITAPASAATLTIPDGVTLIGPAASGTAMTLGNTETITGVKTFGSAGAVGRLKLAGTTSGTTVVDAAAVASGTITVPAASDTLVGKATTDTFTNKTFDTAGAGNSLSINGLAATANTGTGAVVRATTPTIVTPVINGASTGTGVASAATASTLAMRDANANISANSFLAGYTTTATAAGTTTLTVASTQLQFFTGVTTQTVVLPVTSTLVLGQSFTIVNNSSGAVQVQSSGANNILSVAAGNTGIFTVILTSGTTAASWSNTYISSGAGTGTVTSVTCGVGLAGGTFTTTGTCDAVTASTSAPGISELATPAETETGTDTGRTVTPAGLLAAFSGAKTISIPGGAILPATTSGCTPATLESATNKIVQKICGYTSTSADEFGWFQIAWPKGADEGTITAQFYWTAASGSGNVVWSLACLARSDDDAIDTALGTAITVTDTLTATGDLMISPATSAVTIGGTLAENDEVFCRAARVGTNGSDTFSGTAQLSAVKVIYTINAMTDD